MQADFKITTSIVGHMKTPWVSSPDYVIYAVLLTVAQKD